MIYMMRRGMKRQPFCGFVDKLLKKGMKVRKRIDFIFEPQKAIVTDVNLDSWVESGYLVKLKDSFDDKVDNIDLDETIEDVCLVSSIENDEINSDEIEDNIDESYNKINLEEKDIDKEEDEEEEDEEEEDEEEEDEEEDFDYSLSNKKGYKEIEDGFQCLYCDKILKSERRMITHIRKKHTEL